MIGHMLEQTRLDFALRPLWTEMSGIPGARARSGSCDGLTVRGRGTRTVAPDAHTVSVFPAGFNASSAGVPMLVSGAWPTTSQADGAAGSIWLARQLPKR